jgi:GST-like protein
MTIQVYAFSTPNSVKVPIALEELRLPYELKSVNVRKGEQKNADFLSLNPNGKVPVLIDPTGTARGPLVLTESAAILIYLAEKTGRLLPASGQSRARVFEQLFFHASGLGPAFGQSGYFQKQAPEQVPVAITRFSAEAVRVARLLDQVLARSEFSAGHEFTIADIAHIGFRPDPIGHHLRCRRWYREHPIYGERFICGLLGEDMGHFLDLHASCCHLRRSFHSSSRRSLCSRQRAERRLKSKIAQSARLVPLRRDELHRKRSTQFP